MADHLPLPGVGESLNDFLSRGMEDEAAVRLFSSEKLRLAVLHTQFAESSGGGGRRFAASSLPDGGEVCEERKMIDGFENDPAMIEAYPDSWHRHHKAIEAMRTKQREIEAARTCKPWEIEEVE